MNTFSEYIGDSHGWKQRRYQRSYRDSYNYAWSRNPYSYPRMEQWFQIVEQNYLVGFLPFKKLAFAILDARGFGLPSDRPVPFPAGTSLYSMGQDTYVVWTPQGARIAFLAQRRIADLPLPGPAPIYGVSTGWASMGNGSITAMGVALESGMAVYDLDGHLLTTLPYHQDVTRWGSIEMSFNYAMDRYYLWYHPSAWIPDAQSRKMPSYFEETDRTGLVLHSYTLPPLPPFGQARTWQTFLTQRLQTPAFYFGTMLYKKVGAALGDERMRSDLAWLFGPDRRGLTLEISRYALIVGAVLAGAAYLWARRATFPASRAAAWAAFVFAFGLPGLITFRLAADWPRFVACPRCGHGRPVTRETCPRCGAGWPPPPSSGTEILEPASAPSAEALTA